MIDLFFLSTAPNDLDRNEQLNLLQQSEKVSDSTEDPFNSESDEENAHMRRSAPFLRFGRGISPASNSFLRFGRSNPSFLRFGRGGQNGATFLRFGRRALQISPSNFHRFARKGEFLRFG